MNERRPESPQAATLRERAEKAFREMLDGSLEDLDALSPATLRASLHELRVHQIELEMQNEELLRAQAALDASRERYFDLYDLAPVGYCTVGEKGVILEANLTAATLLGAERGALVGRLLSAFISKEGQELYYRCRKNLLDTRQPQECDLQMVRQDGTAFFVHLNFTAARDENGAPVCRVALVDVTASKQVEAAMQEKERLLSESQRIAHIGGWSWAFTGPIQWTDETYRIYGVSPETFTPTLEALVNLAHPEDRPILQEWVRACSAGEKPAEFEFRCVWPDGTVRFLSGRGERICDSENRPAHIFGTVQDITERKRVEEELSRKNADLELFTTAVSHDLKSPLVTIETFLGYLEKDLGDPVARAKDLGYIHGATDKMKRLLDDLLALARIGHLRNEPVVLPLQEVVREALGIVAGQIAERGAHVGITSEPVLLHGDHHQLVAVFQNLLDNAVKFLGDQPDPRIEVGAETEDGEIVLFVRDNGKGVAPCDQPKIFGMFQKLDAQTPGSGIGLAMARRIIEAHGGSIEAQSDGPGKGTTFRFTLARPQRK